MLLICHQVEKQRPFNHITLPNGEFVNISVTRILVVNFNIYEQSIRTTWDAYILLVS